MSNRWDADPAELDELFPDFEDRRIAAILASVQAPEATADPAFRSQLRRQLMQEAWGRGERRRRERGGFWRALFAPSGLAWSGAVAGVLMIAVVVFALSHSGPGDNTVFVRYNVDLTHPVAAVQPIEVTFSQPMDHASTEKAVQITPATQVTFDWTDSNTLKITPVAGSFAPNTQYTVAIAPDVARTATGSSVPAIKPAVFTVAPTPAPTPTATPTPSPTPTPDVTGEKQLAAPPAAGAAWAPDGSIVYFRSADKLLSAPAGGGAEPKTVVSSGVEAFALSPDGTQIVYAGPSAVSTVSADGSHPVEVANAAARAVGWSGGKPVYSTSTSVFAGTELKLAAPQPAAQGTPAAWFSPDGAYFVYALGKTLHALELATGKDTAWPADASFLAWSPDGKRVLYDAGGQFAASPTGQSPVKVGDVTGVVGATWTQPALALIDAQGSFWGARADGAGSQKLATGDYASPVLAPTGNTIVFVRAQGLWAGQLTALRGQAGPGLDKAAAVVTDFMKARVDGKSDAAQAYLDANGKHDFSAPNGPPLLRASSPKLSRYFIVVSGAAGAADRFTVRLVLADTSGKDLSQLDENLTLVADSTGTPVVDHAVDGTAFAYGGGPTVLSVSFEAGAYRVAFDSDLTTATVAAGLQLLDAAGKPVAATPTVQARSVVIPVSSGSGPLKLVVLPALKDKDGRGVPAEYDLDLGVLAPAA